MTIASEITRLQWAKADIKTSIEWKGVSVPSAAKLDAYSSYIDQIVQWGSWMNWIKLRDVFVGNSQASLQGGSIMSWVQNDTPYGCALYAWNQSSSSVTYHLYTFRKTSANDDVTYTLNSSTSFSTAHYWTQIKNPSFWKNWTRCKAFFFIVTDYNSGWDKLFECGWDYTTSNSATITQIASGTSLNLSDYDVDLDGYTQMTTTEWVASATTTQTSNNNYIYLTLK